MITNYNEINNYIIDIITASPKYKDRIYISTIKRILEGNAKSSVANKYKCEKFYGKYDNITKHTIGKGLRELVNEKKIVYKTGFRNKLYFLLNTGMENEKKANEDSYFEELLLEELID